MNESTMWTYLHRVLPASFHTERWTDKLQEGAPDVLYQDLSSERAGVVELKYLPARPRDPATVLLTHGPHGLQPEQSLWLQRWARHRGLAGVLLNIGEHARGEWLYWRTPRHPSRAVTWHSDIRHTQLAPTLSWSGAFDPAHLVLALTCSDREGDAPPD